MSDLLPDGSALGRLIFRFMRLRSCHHTDVYQCYTCHS